MTNRIGATLASAGIYGFSAVLATALVGLAWTSLQQRDLPSQAERRHRDIVECSAAYSHARSARDSSQTLERPVRGAARPDPTTITCRDLLFARPFR